VCEDVLGFVWVAVWAVVRYILGVVQFLPWCVCAVWVWVGQKRLCIDRCSQLYCARRRITIISLFGKPLSHYAVLLTSHLLSSLRDFPTPNQLLSPLYWTPPNLSLPCANKLPSPIPTFCRHILTWRDQTRAHIISPHYVPFFTTLWKSHNNRRSLRTKRSHRPWPLPWAPCPSPYAKS